VGVVRMFFVGLFVVFILANLSLFIGVSSVTPTLLMEGNERAWEILWATRLPRTLSLVLAGASMAISGTIMQLLSRNRFVEPSTAGTVASATLGLLVAMLIAPAMSVFGKMLVATVFALAGSVVFMQILRRIPLRSSLVVPLVGIMLGGGGDATGGIIGAITTFFAYRHDMIQSLQAWVSGDFSSLMQGRYELLWFALPLAALAYMVADRFTVAGMGQEFATNLGLHYRRTMMFGLMIVALVSAVVVVTVGQIPFLGLVVPNIVAMWQGDNMRRSLPFVALGGVGLVLLCDIVGRLIRFPFEVPLGTVMGVVGGAVFLILLYRGRKRLA